MSKVLNKTPVFHTDKAPGELQARVVVTCDKCGTTADHGMTARDTPPTVVARWFRNVGWDIRGEGKKALCPDCRGSKKKKEEERPSLTAAQAHRLLFRLLEDNFDPDLRCYTMGYDDERVAKETGLSLDFVQETRTNAFGSLEDPELLALDKKIAAALEQVQQDHDELVALAAQSAKKAKAELDRLRRDVQQRLAKMR